MNYNFLNLSPSEFENLVRDILQEHFKVFFESFTIGKDNGIDLRCSASDDGKIIVQCKRCESFNTLYSKLIKEVTKVKIINAEKYIIATSVGLTPLQKDKIMKLFHPFIKATSDIFGRDELNNILSRHNDIETKHYKLWFPSSTIFDRTLNSKVYNYSYFEREEINRISKLYVQNYSYSEAMRIISNNNYLVISGTPGIGKTTLARVIVCRLLSQGFDQFFFISDSISEAIGLYKDGIKQIFLFDDFLGRNFLEVKPNINEESKLIRFIDKIKKSKDKVLILTTREYILNQAKAVYEIFNNNDLDSAKCVIELSRYSRFNKAKILYNHLFFSNIPINAIEELIKKERYFSLIDHENFNPRLIETVINSKFWENVLPEEFPSRFEKFLDNPESIWLHVYENQITYLSKVILAIIFTLEPRIYLSDVLMAVKSFTGTYSNKYGLIFNEIDFKRSLKELENSFIRIDKDPVNNIIVEYQNASVENFLINYLSDNVDLIGDIIESAIFWKQVTFFFKSSQRERIPKDCENRFGIYTDESISNKLVIKILKNFKNLLPVQLSPFMTIKGEIAWYKEKNSSIRKIRAVYEEFLISNEQNTLIFEFIISEFQKIIYLEGTDIGEKSDYIYLLKKLKSKIDYNADLLVETFFNSMVSLTDFTFLKAFERLEPSAYFRVVQVGDKVSNKIEEFVEYSIKGSNYDLADLAIRDIEQIQADFNVDLSEHLIKLTKLKDNLPDGSEYTKWKGMMDEFDEQEKMESEEISNLFNSFDIN